MHKTHTDGSEQAFSPGKSAKQIYLKQNYI